MSKYLRGTAYDQHRDRWVARIHFNNKKYQRYFSTEQEAHEWYVEKSLELYGFDRFAKKL